MRLPSPIGPCRKALAEAGAGEPTQWPSAAPVAPATGEYWAGMPATDVARSTRLGVMLGMRHHF
ncbi:hypothetical protein CBM2626_B10250 [Cupriavidus taiwanensis]|nr:hypothetical protein CBM2626_B10250 [Cupriavidus taiwanensis]